MRKEYDLSKSRKNSYASQLKKQIAIRLDEDTIEYFKGISGCAICEMEHGEARHFILPYPLARHQEEFARPTVVYKSIRRGENLVGFVILALDPDGLSVEFRRIVVSEPGRGSGKRAVELVRDVCRRELGRTALRLFYASCPCTAEVRP